MRHVKLKPGVEVNDAALRALIDAAYADGWQSVEQAPPKFAFLLS
jgi:hypothetical protein